MREKKKHFIFSLTCIPALPCFLAWHISLLCSCEWRGAGLFLPPTQHISRWKHSKLQRIQIKVQKTSLDNMNSHTWVALHSSAPPQSAPSQTWCSGPTGQGLIVCAYQCDRTGPEGEMGKIGTFQYRRKWAGFQADNWNATLILD